MSGRYVFGDVHGHVEPFLDRLREAGLVDDSDRWAGGTSTLWLTGDFVDRGPLGAEAVATVMRLQEEAEAAGGAVLSVLGNHDLLLFAVARFGDFPTSSRNGRLWIDWLVNGGRERDLEHITDEHLDWLAALPALARVDSTLLTHCDALFYRDFGRSVEEVNAAVAERVARRDTSSWDELLGIYARRMQLADPTAAREFAAAFGCERIVHGHTPIPIVTGDEPDTIVEPLVYADGVCVNVDGGLYLGGPGFVWPLGQ